MDAPQCVCNYKSLANIERAFRSLKTVDLKMRPIHHRTADRVRAHSFHSLMAELATIVRNTCRTPSAGADAPTFEITTTANPKQLRALALIQTVQP